RRSYQERFSYNARVTQLHHEFGYKNSQKLFAWFSTLRVPPRPPASPLSFLLLLILLVVINIRRGREGLFEEQSAWGRPAQKLIIPRRPSQKFLWHPLRPHSLSRSMPSPLFRWAPRTNWLLKLNNLATRFQMICSPIDLAIVASQPLAQFADRPLS